MKQVRKLIFLTLVLVLAIFQNTKAQKTQIRGFVDGLVSYQKDKLNFGFGEQDLFITSELTDRFSFLGETVFKFSLGTPTSFSVGVERIVLKYNYSGNHNILLGKHHTPINYWNDTYHHGRVFFPTIDRPALFSANIVPLHTTGISLQGSNLGDGKFGYDLMVGNGIGSSDIVDNDKYKSVTAAVHIKPVDGLSLGASFYHDVISKGAKVNDKIIGWKVNQNLVSGSVAYFGKKGELLVESTFGSNKTDTTGAKITIASYGYAGLKINEKWVPYIRVDNIHYQEGEIFYQADNMISVITGIRYDYNYLVVVKLEFRHEDFKKKGINNMVIAQVAIGF